MFQTVITLMRGACADQEEAMRDACAIPLLRQQVREAGAAVEDARRDLARAMAALKAEQRVLQDLDSRIDSLSASARKALRDGREDLGRAAASQIARLEDERKAREGELHRREGRVAELREKVVQGRSRLRRVVEGLRLATVDESLRQAGLSGTRTVVASDGKIARAEATLARIEERNRGDADFEEALQSIDMPDDAGPALAEAGYGPTPRTSPDDVFARLKAQAAASD